MEKVNLKTADGLNIVGNHYKGPKGSPAVLMLHMMPAVKESWDGFAKKLNKAGFGALAIDLRGHGESDGGPEGYRQFSNEEHQKSMLDARAGIEFQIAEGHSKIFLAGASIGANLSLQALAESERISAAVLLSAGLNYRGVETLSLVKQIRPEQGVFFVASKDDRIEGADKMSEELYSVSGGKKEVKIFEMGGHGTDLFTAHPDLMDEVISWLKQF